MVLRVKLEFVVDIDTKSEDAEDKIEKIIPEEINIMFHNIEKELNPRVILQTNLELRRI